MIYYNQVQHSHSLPDQPYPYYPIHIVGRAMLHWLFLTSPMPYPPLVQYDALPADTYNSKMKGKQREKFTIIIRVRPKIKDDALGYREPDMEDILENDTSSITIKRKNNQEKIFRFNQVYNPGEQRDIYERSAHLVESVFEGYNATFLAYGQTGTGKTHTVFGSEGHDSGYFYSSVEDIFSIIKRRLNQRQFAVRVSFVEFYLDNIYDLLEGASRKLEIKESNEDGIFIKDLTEVSVRSAEELFACMRKAVKNRKTEETSINKRSSRSHAVIQITVLQRWNEGGETRYLKAMLKIVDLAGSERVSKTESNGNRLQQAKRINKEITTLGKCINLLAQAQKQNKQLANDLSSRFNFNKSHIPFRDAKITRYLSESLQGKAKIVLCVCISKFAIHIQESFSSLMFATQASTLKVDSIRNETYTMTVKKSAEKYRQGYDTPLRGKTESKKEERSSYRDVNNNNNRSDYKQTSHSLNKIQGGNRPTSAINGQKLIDKFQKQMGEITSYLEKRQVSTKNQSKEAMQANLIAMHKIFSILRQNNLPSFY